MRSRTIRPGIALGWTLAAIALAGTGMLLLGELTQAATVTVDIEGFVFLPSTRTISVGDTVTWTNKDGAPHTATEGAAGNPAPSFTTGLLNHGQSASLTFTQPGTYPYYCEEHPAMIGRVIVQQLGTSPTPAATPTATPTRPPGGFPSKAYAPGASRQ